VAHGWHWKGPKNEINLFPINELNKSGKQVQGPEKGDSTQKKREKKKRKKREIRERVAAPMGSTTV